MCSIGSRWLPRKLHCKRARDTVGYTLLSRKESESTSFMIWLSRWGDSASEKIRAMDPAVLGRIPSAQSGPQSYCRRRYLWLFRPRSYRRLLNPVTVCLSDGLLQKVRVDLQSAVHDMNTVYLESIPADHALEEISPVIMVFPEIHQNLEGSKFSKLFRWKLPHFRIQYQVKGCSPICLHSCFRVKSASFCGIRRRLCQRLRAGPRLWLPASTRQPTAPWARWGCLLAWKSPTHLLQAILDLYSCK